MVLFATAKLQVAQTSTIEEEREYFKTLLLNEDTRNRASRKRYKSFDVYIAARPQ